MAIVDLTERISNNRLTQIGEKFKIGESWAGCVAVFECECGTVFITTVTVVKTGKTKSCGCLNREIVSAKNTTHGGNRSPTHNSWTCMRQRCTDESRKDYKGRGITVCERWLNSYTAFLEDMGERPEGTTLDRIENNGNYEPGNCKWSTKLEQDRNKRNNRMLTFNNETMCVTAWAEKLGMSVSTIKSRLYRGLSVEKALSTTLRSLR